MFEFHVFMNNMNVSFALEMSHLDQWYRTRGKID